jgi:hypothetical protein
MLASWSRHGMAAAMSVAGTTDAEGLTPCFIRRAVVYMVRVPRKAGRQGYTPTLPYAPCLPARPAFLGSRGGHAFVTWRFTHAANRMAML